MRPEHIALWERIEAFDIDGQPTPSLSFAQGLARENSWSLDFADQAVHEYRRYVFLCMTAGRHMCPSEEVDQVWHLHLTYTRSYWQRFCGEVLQNPLHHEPTRGGSDEGRKHWAMYSDTLLAYREAFGEEPPPDLWPSADQRFGSDHLRQYNPKDCWLLRKPSRSWLAVAAILVVTAALLGCGGPNNNLNPFELRGLDFLPVLFLAYTIAFFVAFLIRRAYKGPDLEPGDAIPDLDPYEVAYLSGGRLRVLATALVSLKDGAHAGVDGTGKVWAGGSPPPGEERVEDVVYAGLSRQIDQTVNMKPLQAAVKSIEDRRFARLQELGLTPTGTQRLVGTAIPMLLCLSALGALGVPRLVVGTANQKPTAFLVASLIGLAIVTLVAFARSIRRTHRGEAVVANLSQQNAGLRTLSLGHHPAGAAMAVALFGVAVLSGTAYADLYTRMQKFDSAGAGGGCGSSACSASGCGGGDGGGGGSGCGGCGGGGGD